MNIHFKSEENNVKDIYISIKDKINDKESFKELVLYSDKIVILSQNDAKISNFKEDISKELDEFIYDYNIGHLIYQNDDLKSNYICFIKHNPKNPKMLLEMYCLRYGISDDILEHSMNILDELDINKSDINNDVITYALIDIVSDYNDKTIFANPDMNRDEIEKAREYIIEKL